jgi:hypothetical protein
MISSNSHFNVSETSPPSVTSVEGSPDYRVHPVHHIRVSQDSPVVFEITRNLHTSSMGCVVSVDVDGIELDS